MPAVAARAVAAELVRPLTVAKPLADETQSTVPPNPSTQSVKSAGALPVNETMCLPVAMEEPDAAIRANDGVRRFDCADDDVAGADGCSVQAARTPTAMRLAPTRRRMGLPSRKMGLDDDDSIRIRNPARAAKP